MKISLNSPGIKSYVIFKSYKEQEIMSEVHNKFKCYLIRLSDSLTFIILHFRPGTINNRKHTKCTHG